LIAAYSRQAPRVTPRIIDSIAVDFRLDVETRPVERMLNSESLSGNVSGDMSESMNVQKAARTLLELYSLLRNEQAREEVRTR
jgi:hypothetical protein